MDEYVTCAVWGEFAKRIEAEETRQNRRLEAAEGKIEELQKMSAAIEKLAISMEAMAKEQAKMAGRLDTIESEPGNNWKKAVWVVIVAILGGVVAYLLKNIGL